MVNEEPKQKRRLSSKSGIVRPPTPVNGLDLRTWLAGCALSNPNVVTSNVGPEDAMVQAISFADKMISAMKTPPRPQSGSMKAPSPAVMERWENNIKNEATRDKLQKKPTVPAAPLASRPPRETVSPPAFEAKASFEAATATLRRASNTMRAVRPEDFSAITRPNGSYKVKDVEEDIVTISPIKLRINNDKP